MKNVTILGIGYVGLTLAAVMAEKEFLINGTDINKRLVENLNNCKPHFYEKRLESLLRKHIGKNLYISDKIPSERQDAYIVAVGTPVDEQTKEPLLDHV